MPVAAAGSGGAAARGTARAASQAPLDGSSMAAFYDSVSVALDATPLGQWSRFLNYGYADPIVVEQVHPPEPTEVLRRRVRAIGPIVGPVIGRRRR